MLFIFLLVIATISIAGAAAFFSVYGLAHTFSGTFWSVVVMGGSLEAGKLIAASYLYRYWTQTHWVLKTYLIGGVAALMIMTSTGIFGYLSSGYQADVLPLKQLNEQIRLLEDERTRTIDRKRQIDEQLSKGPVVGSVGTNSKIDPNAAKTIREARRAQESLNKQYKVEQEQTTKRVAELDKNLLELKQQLVKTEAHIGPITYIANVFGAEPDDATKWLIFLIIFAFDPMAVALTIAVNNVIRIRQQQKEQRKEPSDEIIQTTNEVHPPPTMEPVYEKVEASVDNDIPVVERVIEAVPDTRPPDPVEQVVEQIVEEQPAKVVQPEERGMYLWVRDVEPPKPPEPDPEPEEQVADQPILGDIRTDKMIDANLAQKISQLRAVLEELNGKSSLTVEEQRHKRQIENLIEKTEVVYNKRHSS